MNNNKIIPLDRREGKSTVSSRVLAELCEIQHENVLGLIYENKEYAEERFGVFRFETGKPSKGSIGGRPSKTFFLTEDQATFIITLMRNTEPVRHFKGALVKAFSAARAELAGKKTKALPAEPEDGVIRSSAIECALQHPGMRGATLRDYRDFAVVAREFLKTDAIASRTVTLRDGQKMKVHSVDYLNKVAELASRTFQVRQIEQGESENPFILRDFIALLERLAQNGEGAFTFATILAAAAERKLFAEIFNLASDFRRRSAFGKVLSRFNHRKFDLPGGSEAKWTVLGSGNSRRYFLAIL